MASPFHVFRRHQKVMLAVFGVLIMLVFVVGGAMMQLLDTGQARRSGAHATVVTWADGSVTESELDQMYHTHRLVVNFLSGVVEETRKKEGTPIAPGFGTNQFGEVNPGIPIAYNEQTLIETMLLARKARDMGMVVNDAAIYDFLENQLGVGLLTRSDLANILQRTTRGQITDQQMFDALRPELLAQNMRSLGQSALFANRRPIVTPAAAWDYHLRLHQRAAVELMPIDVEEYVDQVKQEPTQAEIRALYDKYKDEFDSPDSPEPGFKQRQQLAFDYVKGRLDDFTEKELAGITEEQIREEYEKRVAEGRYRVTAPPPPMPDDPRDAVEPAPTDDPAEDAPAESPAPETPDETPPRETPGADEPPAAETPAEEPKPADPPASSDETPASESSPAEEEPSTDATPQDSPAQPADEDQSLGRSNRSKFVSLLEEDAEATQPASDKATDPPAGTADPAVEPEPSDETPAAEPSEPQPAKAEPQGPAPGPDTPAREEPATDGTDPASGTDAATSTPAPEEPAETPADPAETPAEPAGTPADPAETPADPAEPAEQPADEQPEPEVQPYEEVRDEIARELATQPAREKMNAALAAAEKTIESYYRRLVRWDALKDTDRAIEKPAPIDIESLAAEHRLTAGSVPLVDPLHVDEYELGQAMSFSFAGGQFRQLSFADIAYGPRVALYEPHRIRSFVNDEEFVYWAVDQVPEQVPALDQVREQVVAAWKKQNAVDKAINAAKELADKARQANRPLAEVFPDRADRIIEPEPFSWMTIGSVPQMSGMPHISRVEGVEFPSTEFMREVFSLEPGEVGVTTDRPKTTVYVVRLVGESPPLDVLRETFMVQNYRGDERDPTLFIAFQERNEVFAGWYENLEESMNLKWVRPPKMLVGAGS